MQVANVLLSILWLALITYAVLGGADFGAGMLELFAVGPTGPRQDALIDESMDPVWEVNHVWLIFLLVVFFTAFPSAFAAINVVLFIPLLLALIGIVLRGAAFAFRVHGIIKRSQTVRILSRIFSVASAMTPFFLAVAAAAIASGHIQIHNQSQLQTNTGSYWLTPFALTIGAMALTLCVTISAIYLTVEATSIGATELAETFRQRGLIAGALTAVLGLLGLFLAPSEASFLWNAMLDRALPLVIVTMLIGLAAAAALWFKRYSWARVLIVAETAFLLISWGVSQFPYIIPPDVTIENASSPQQTQVLLLVGILIALIIVVPSLWFMFYVFKLKKVTTVTQNPAE
ncbi:MAG TPA: cytochrome d ubiquinol oxidase subunit II [Ktedonobacteraceae bacterium]